MLQNFAPKTFGAFLKNCRDELRLFLNTQRTDKKEEAKRATHIKDFVRDFFLIWWNHFEVSELWNLLQQLPHSVNEETETWWQKLKVNVW